MHCPFCVNLETAVKDSRVVDDGKSIKRRRFCTTCNARFTTFERLETKEIIVEKKSGATEFFNLDKLRSSVKMSVRKRNVSSDELERLINNIYSKIADMSENNIMTSAIGDLVLESLFDLDKVAYVRFASVYKNFTDTQDFQSFIKNLAA
ncbi:MAG: transcriptional repressor NrdR [Rickettsiales bacterium]|jgi:transcriptional repressor NrdR|nr:transcriptional repressor NrdR [Rickettsiales bacterium]